METDSETLCLLITSLRYKVTMFAFTVRFPEYGQTPAIVARVCLIDISIEFRWP